MSPSHSELPEYSECIELRDIMLGSRAYAGSGGGRSSNCSRVLCGEEEYCEYSELGRNSASMLAAGGPSTVDSEDPGRLESSYLDSSCSDKRTLLRELATDALSSPSAAPIKPWSRDSPIPVTPSDVSIEMREIRELSSVSNENDSCDAVCTSSSGNARRAGFGDSFRMFNGLTAGGLSGL